MVTYVYTGGRVPDRDVEKRLIIGALSSNGYPTALVKKNWHQTLLPLPLLNWTHPRQWWSSLTSSTVKIHPAHPLPTEDPYLLQTTPDSETGTSQFKGPGSFSAEGRSNLQDCLQWLPQSVCRPDKQNIGPTAEGTQTGYSEWTPGTVGGGACCPGVA